MNTKTRLIQQYSIECFPDVDSRSYWYSLSLGIAQGDYSPVISTSIEYLPPGLGQERYRDNNERESSTMYWKRRRNTAVLTMAQQLLMHNKASSRLSVNAGGGGMPSIEEQQCKWTLLLNQPVQLNAPGGKSSAFEAWGMPSHSQPPQSCRLFAIPQ